MKNITNRMLNFFERRRYFKKSYYEIYNETCNIYSSFRYLCSVYSIDEYNIDQFNIVKDGIVVRTKNLHRKFNMLEDEVDWIGELGRDTRKKKVATLKMFNEILRVCDR